MLSLLIAFFLFFICRLLMLLPPKKSKASESNPTRGRNETCHLAVFLGSGGHTSEALTLLCSLNFERYTPRTYIVSEGDTLSVQRARDFESWVKVSKPNLQENVFTIFEIPRARRVHQSLLATAPTALISLMTCFYHFCWHPALSRRPFADVLILNGPGTSVILWATVYVSRMLFIPGPRVIYVESFARVTSLSLSGRLLRNWVDRFIVQWPEVIKDGKRGEYRGWLV